MKDEPSAVMIEFQSEKVKKRYLSDILGYYCGNTGQEEMMITILNKMYNLEQNINVFSTTNKYKLDEPFHAITNALCS